MEIQSSADNLSKLPDRGEKKFLPLKPDINAENIKNDDLEARKAKLRKAAQGFEAIFARQLLKNMRSSLSGDGMFGAGSIGEIYSDMMDNAIGEQISKRGSLGLADVIYRQMIKSIDPEGNTGNTKNNINYVKDRAGK